MKLQAPAKVNLYLRVLRRRRDGFHDIETVFERVGLYDDLEILPADDIRLETSARNIPLDRTNLVWRAADMLREHTGTRKGALLRLTKRIPVESGLGGGSSDAAAAFVGLNRFWKLGLSRKTLIELGGKLGSDVAFFILDTPLALGTGKGEKLRKIPSKGFKIWHVLVKPSFGICTRKAYQGLNPASLTPQKCDVRMLLHSIQNGPAEALSERLVNSLELSLNNRLRTILKIKKSLANHGAVGTLLSGSGSCVFGIFRSKKEAEKAARKLKANKGWRVYTASTV